jgi:hypothetical protein
MNSAHRFTILVLLGAVLAAATATTAGSENTAAGVARVVAGPFDGRWTATVTSAQLRRAGATGSLVAKLYGPYTALYQKGRFEFRNHRTGAIHRGTFSVRGKVSRLVWPNGGIGVKPGQVSECTWSVYRDRLTFKAIPGRPSLLCDAGVWTRAG